MSPARARTRTTRSGVELTNHEATAPPTYAITFSIYFCQNKMVVVIVVHSLCFPKQVMEKLTKRETLASAHYPVKSLFYAGVQFYRDSTRAFNDQIKIRENRGL